MTTSNTTFRKNKNCPTTAADQKLVVSESVDTRAAQKVRSQSVTYLTNRQVRKRYQIGNTTLYRWINDKKINFPKPHQLGPRCVRWLQSELEAWESQ